MIARLTGTVVDTRLTHIILDVGGVGYSVAIRLTSHFAVGDRITLHTHLAVRENAQDLYGFLTEDELTMFEHLIKLPKIGPKSAMQILSQAELDLLKQAVMQNDPTYLSKMSGIGKKSAEKIVLGLKDIFESNDFEFSHGEGGPDADTIDALIALGYSQKDAREALQKLPPDITDTNERIKQALRVVGS